MLICWIDGGGIRRARLAGFGFGKVDAANKGFAFWFEGRRVMTRGVRSATRGRVRRFRRSRRLINLLRWSEWPLYYFSVFYHEFVSARYGQVRSELFIQFHLSLGQIGPNKYFG